MSSPSEETIQRIDRLPAPARERSLAGRLVLAAVGVGLAVWCGLRIKSALATREQLAAARADTARAATQKTSARVAVVAPAAASWQPTVALDGTLGPARETDLGFKAGGRLAAVRVRLGQSVRAGEVLATLDATEATAQVDAAGAQVRAAEAQLALTDDSDRRMGALMDKGAVSQMSGTQAHQQRALAAAQLEGARANLALAQAALRNHTLAAPFSGTITRVPSGAGVIVAPGTPLFHVQDTSTLKLDGTIGEGDVQLVRSGAPVEVAGHAGTLTAVLGAVDAATRRVPVEAQLANDGSLLAGSFVRAQVKGNKALAVLKLPSTALRPGSQDEVMIVKEGHLVARRVTFAIGGDGALYVRAGLDARDQVVAAPSPEAADGDLAEVQP
jgi:RND family efflux transporter MFP subunit